MNIDKLKLILAEVKHIADNYSNISRASGDNFNIFQILNLDASEVRLHSTILAELLNPDGSHGQGDLFLKQFTELLDIRDFDTKSAKAYVEFDIGPINRDYTRGGRIDILVTNKNGKHIVIENKIYAGDQKNQLIRYYNFSPNSNLFYLTLDGRLPSNESTGEVVTPDKYNTISYGKEILDWLERCKREAALLPLVRETIVQYINLIKVLTNQTARQTMKDEIRTLILKNPEYSEAIDLSNQVLCAIMGEAKQSFFNLINEYLPKEPISIGNDLSVLVHCDIDGDGVYIGYRLLKQNENYSNSSDASKYVKILKDIFSNMNYSSWNIGWYNPLPFKRYMKFEGLDKQVIIKLVSDNAYLQEFVKPIIEQEKKIRDEFFIRIKGL